MHPEGVQPGAAASTVRAMGRYQTSVVGRIRTAWGCEGWASLSVSGQEGFGIGSGSGSGSGEGGRRTPTPPSYSSIRRPCLQVGHGVGSDRSGGWRDVPFRAVNGSDNPSSRQSRDCFNGYSKGNSTIIA